MLKILFITLFPYLDLLIKDTPRCPSPNFDHKQCPRDLKSALPVLVPSTVLSPVYTPQSFDRIIRHAGHGIFDVLYFNPSNTKFYINSDMEPLAD